MGLVSWKTICSWTREREMVWDGSSALLFFFFFAFNSYYYYINSTSDHQALDPEVLGLLP